MSSNAFARSRPRIRHQRVPKSHGPTHPRFLQLVKELERLDAVKKKQQLIEGESLGSSSCSSGTSTSTTAVDNRVFASSDCVDETCSPVNTITTNLPNVAESCSSMNSHNNGMGSFNCISSLNAAHTSNGYRSLDCNQSTSTLNDNYYRQNNTNHNHNNPYMHHNHLSGHHHHNHNHHHQHQLNNQIVQHNYREHPNYYSNNSSHNVAHHHHQQQPTQDDRCSSKCLSTATSTTLSLGFPKSSLEQNSPGFSNASVDLRQDENRSKRKRVSNESSPLVPSKKLPSSSSCSGSSNNKRHKSSPEPARPLSPSFTKCPICLLDCMDRDPSFTNTCFHLFCYVCIENWTKNKATCPLCRTKFSKIIYNIRSESCYDEKIASPIRRDDDDDRIMYEQLQGLHTNQMVLNRNSGTDDTRLLFDNLRGSDVLMQPFAFVNQIDQRPDSISNFNSAATTSFNTSVPHPPFTSYNSITSNYLLIPSGNSRLQQLTNTVTSAYTGNTSLNNSNVDPSRISRISRSGRYIYSRNYADLQPVDNSIRISREASSNLNSAGAERPHQHQHQYPNNHHQHQNPHGQHRSTTVEMGTRQSQRMERAHISQLYPIPPRYLHTNVYSRRPFINPPIEQHILDNLYRQMPDI